MLNSVLIAKLPTKHHKLFSIFIRRVQVATDHYRAAIDPIRQFSHELEAQKFGLYITALNNLEICVLNAHIASCCGNSLLNLIGQRPSYTNNDGSDYDRLRRLNNRIKHFNEDIVAGTDINTPMWITNDGLSCIDCDLSFDELHEILNCAVTDCEGFSEGYFKDIMDLRNPASNIPAEGL